MVYSVCVVVVVGRGAGKRDGEGLATLRRDSCSACDKYGLGRSYAGISHHDRVEVAIGNVLIRMETVVL
jgi:hypothetical protein